MAFSLMIAARLSAKHQEWHNAVVLQMQADVLLAEADYALYSEDAEIRHDMLASAKEQLGAQVATPRR